MQTITLNNGMTVPAIGFGTYNPKGGDNKKMVLDAIECGYRYIDTASLYETERAVGAAVKECGLPRNELTIASKAWRDEIDDIEAALDRSLNRIGTDYLDIFFIHWPRNTEGDDYKERDLKAYRCLEKAVDKGLVRGIGLSNFLPHHTDNILNNCRIKPVFDQLELHPGYTQQAAQDYLKQKNIQAQAWSPFGRGALVDNPILSDIAKKYGMTTAQLCLSFLIQEGIMPLIKSREKERMLSNLAAFDFELDKEDMSIIRCMPQNTWLGEHPDFAIPRMVSNPNQ